MIYEGLLVHKGDLYFYPTYSVYHCDHLLHPQILNTSRLVNTEATLLLHAMNMLVVDSALSLSRLRKKIMPKVFAGGPIQLPAHYAFVGACVRRSSDISHESSVSCRTTCVPAVASH
jgi:hypothetical protein